VHPSHVLPRLFRRVHATFSKAKAADDHWWRVVSRRGELSRLRDATLTVRDVFVIETLVSGGLGN